VRGVPILIPNFYAALSKSLLGNKIHGVPVLLHTFILGTKGNDGGADICDSREEKATLMERAYF
jgi:hypothetical protein